MRQRFTRWLSLVTVCFMLTAYCTTARAALLDMGPTVPPVVGSTPPTLGHGFPLWYRDINRVPLELCTNEAMCFFARPNPLAPVSFPVNMPDEVFFYAAAASADLLNPVGGKALLFLAVEGNIIAETNGSTSLVSFARVRIRVDTPVVGQYKVTTPYKQYIFNVTDIAAGINFTEDIGLGANGVFTGALSGTVGPFLYCTDAPFPAVDGTGGSYIGKNAVNCPVLGSTFIDPVTSQPANLFRVQGPVGFVAAETNQFSVQGKIHEGAIPTPLTVDRSTYTLDSAGMQVTVFSTTQIQSNQTVGGISFPGRFALTGAAPSTLQFSGASIPAQALLTTNSPADGKFYLASGVFIAPGTIPTTVTVTNSADTPITEKVVPLVDEVVISEASFASTAIPPTLKVVAASGNKVAPPALSVIMLDGQQEVLLGTIAGGGQLLVSFPFTPAGGNKTYNIPPERVTVKSALGGSYTAIVSTPLNHQPVANNDTATVTPLGTVIIDVAANDMDPDFGDFVVPASVTLVALPLKGTAVKEPNGTITYTNTSGTGTDSFTYKIADSAGVFSNVAVVTVTINNPPVANAFTATTNEDTAVDINVASQATDPDGNLTIAPASVQITAPLHGTVSALGNGVFRYTPALNYNGPDSFEYTVRDTSGAVSAVPAVVSITVNAVADPPLAANDLTTSTPMNNPVTIDVLLNDSHPDAAQGSIIVPSTLNILAIPANGTASITSDPGTGYRKIVFQPALNFFGTTSFTYFVSDNAAVPRVSAPATVTVTVTPVNIPPTAVNDVASTFVGIPRTINVVQNDTDADGTINKASVAIAALPAPTNGTAVANGDGTVTFTPTTSGTGTFSYNVQDNAGAVSNNATVSVSITAVATVTDSVTVLKGQFTTSTRIWNMEGSTANATAGTLVTIRIGSGLTGQVLGTAPVATDGRWKFQLGANPGNLGPDANNTISVTLPSGASRLAFPIAVK